MSPEPRPTKFLPAERYSSDEIRGQVAAVEAVPVVRVLIDAMPNFVLILNDLRQVVCANKSALDMLRVDPKSLLGRRPGEIFDCLHAKEEEGGCGTTEFCTVCGAANAIACAVRGKPDAQECRIQAESPKDDLDLLVWSTPLALGGRSFVVFAAMDISHEKRRRALERIFFHDVLNTAGGVRTLAELIGRAGEDEVSQYTKLLEKISQSLVEEICGQRDLAAMESGEISPVPAPLAPRVLLEGLAGLYRVHEVGAGKTVAVDPGTCEEAVVADRTLLMRAVGNMIKNALEAEKPGAVVSVGCRRRADGRFAFWVRNPSPMPREVQLQIFQRSFTTKGAGRGLGTYSIKLLVERYLKGEASFSSSPKDGTEFRAVLPAQPK